MSEPLIQVVDEHDQPIGAATKHELWQKGLRHRDIRIVITDPAGRVLLQKRSPTKPNSPNCWETSVAGHVDVGEDYQTAACRELTEELDMSGVTLTELGSFTVDRTEGWRIIKRFTRVFGLVVPSGTTFRFNPQEVAELRWMTLPELTAALAAAPKEYTDGVHQIVKRKLLGA